MALSDGKSDSCGSQGGSQTSTVKGQPADEEDAELELTDSEEGGPAQQEGFTNAGRNSADW